MKFEEWFKTKLVVGRFPLPKEIEKSDYKHIINVSDEFIIYCYESAIRSNISYFWFPMNECKEDIGINSIYGALQILRLAEKKNEKVLLHCHAGVNRSPTVAAAYYFMRSKNHLPKENNRMLNNIEAGYLPSIHRMESFLQKASEAFEKEETMRGGYLDSCKLKSGF